MPASRRVRLLIHKKMACPLSFPPPPPLSLLVAATAGLMAYAADADDSLDLSARLHPADGRLLQLELARRPTLQLLELQAPPSPHACTFPLRTHSTRSARPAPPQHSHGTLRAARHGCTATIDFRRATGWAARASRCSCRRCAGLAARNSCVTSGSRPTASARQAAAASRVGSASPACRSRRSSCATTGWATAPPRH